MTALTIEAKLRTITGKKVKKIRQDKFIPAVIYGHKTKPQNLQVPYNQFEKIYGVSGAGSLIDLKIDDHAPTQALIQDIQFDNKTNQIQHIDFYKVRKGEKLKTSVRLNFIGESKAVKELGAVLVKTIDEVEVECLPQDLPTQIDVDISDLADFEDLIKIKNLVIPKTVAILNNQEEAVASVAKPQVEEAPPVQAPAEVAPAEGENPPAIKEAS